MKNVVGIFFRYKLTIIQIIYSQNSILFYNNKIFSPTMKTTALLMSPWGMCIDPKEYICFHCGLGALYDSKIHPWKLARSLFQSLSILWEPNSISTFPYPRDDCEVLRKLMQQQWFFNLRTIPETLAIILISLILPLNLTFELISSGDIWNIYHLIRTCAPQSPWTLPWRVGVGVLVIESPHA